MHALPSGSVLSDTSLGLKMSSADFIAFADAVAMSVYARAGESGEPVVFTLGDAEAPGAN